MKNIILFFMFVIFSGSAAAKWTLIGSSESLQTEGVTATGRGFKVFIDKETITRHGDRATMWSLTNYESPQEIGNKEQLSSTSLDEYDCRKKEFRTLAFYWFSRYDGEGDVVYSEEIPGKMKPIIEGSGSAHEKAWSAACGK